MENSGYFPKASHLRQSRTTQPSVHTRCFSVSIIHQTLTWTTGSLTWAQMLMHALQGVRTQEKSLAAPGNRTCVSGVMVRCSNQLSYILTHRCKQYLLIWRGWLENEIDKVALVCMHIWCIRVHSENLLMF